MDARVTPSVATATCTRPFDTHRRAAQLVIAAMGFSLVSVPLVAFGPADLAAVLDPAQQLLAIVAGVGALVVAYGAATATGRLVSASFATGLGLAGLGILLWQLLPDTMAAVGGPVGGLFMLAVVIAGAALLRAFTADLRRDQVAQAALEGAIVVIATACVLQPVWGDLIRAPDTGLTTRLAVAFGVAFVAGPMAGFLSLYDRGLQTGMWGPYAVLDGLAIGGLAWLAWMVTIARGTVEPVTPLDYGFSVAVFLVAWGGITWDRPPAHRAVLSRLSVIAVDALPLVAITACMMAVVVLRDDPDVEVLYVGAAAVATMSLVRQWLLVRAERSARGREREAAERLAAGVAERSQVLAILRRLDPEATPQVTAQDICDRALDLRGIDLAFVLRFDAGGTASIIAGSGTIRGLDEFDRTLPAEVAAQLRTRAAEQVWITLAPEGRTALDDAARAEGIAVMANASILADALPVGVLCIASRTEVDGADQAQRLVTIHELGMLAGAVLGPGLLRQIEAERARSALRGMIERQAYRTVYQPIVDLATRTTVGHEALTRFDDGVRPDLRFEEAERLGIGPELEVATLRTALRDGIGLPPNTYLSINASPELAANVGRVVSLLGGASHPVVLEVTEHGAVASYAILHEALETLRGFVRIAVDDVGAGYAGLRQILELRPDILKLDIALVRDVDTDIAKRALIGSLVAFAANTGSTVLGEGIETEAEAVALHRLGVHLGQGYLFGKPAPLPGRSDPAVGGGAVDGG